MGGCISSALANSSTAEFMMTNKMHTQNDNVNSFVYLVNILNKFSVGSQEIWKYVQPYQRPKQEDILR